MNASWNRHPRSSACGHTTRHHRFVPSRRTVRSAMTMERRPPSTSSIGGVDTATSDGEPLHTNPRVPTVVLKIGDGIASFVAFAAVLAAVGRLEPRAILLAPVAVAIGLAVIWSAQLWDSRVTAMRWIELSRLTRVAAIVTAAALALDRLLANGPGTARTLTASVVAWLLMIGWRSIHRSWVTHQRRHGRFVRRTIVVGTDARGLELVRLFATHPEAGIRVTGVIGSQFDAQRAGISELWLGERRDAARILSATPSESIVVCSSAVSPRMLQTVVDTGRGIGREVLIDPGLAGVDARRVVASPVAHEAFLYVDAGAPSRAGRCVKRMVDIIVSSVLLALASPVFAVVAILVKRTDGGPVFFRQRRVGRDDHDFEILKFRTMVVDAEARLGELERGNQRSGPLFKLSVDPRVTRIGNFLRKTSLDELPQLLNVLKGEMSLVGPRPALRREVDEFPHELRQRHHVRPGITGLWQVEARDNPAFDAYQRLDLFYVRNWSLSLDLMIMLGTVEQLLVRPFLSRGRGEVDTPAAIATLAA
jgi:exopolysaccharide biosynthesis polyprenyl glycosylphosphotransferase